MLETILQSLSFIPHTAAEELIFEYFFEAYIMNIYLRSFSFIPLTASEEMIFKYFFTNLSFMPWQPFKFSSLDKIHMFVLFVLRLNVPVNNFSVPG